MLSVPVALQRAVAHLAGRADVLEVIICANLTLARHGTQRERLQAYDSSAHAKVKSGLRAATFYFDPILDFSASATIYVNFGSKVNATVAQLKIYSGSGVTFLPVAEVGVEVL